MSGPTPCRELTCNGLIAWLKGKVNHKTGLPATVPVGRPMPKRTKGGSP
jgi:hypothetical protein